MGDKEWALDLVKQFDERWGAGVWPHINRSDLAASLRERLANPNALNQGNTNLCGVASFVRDWLLDDPVGYVWFAICLFEKGVGNFSQKGQGGRTIRPSQELKNSVIAKINRNEAKTLAPADWIVMASLREDLNLSLNYRADEGWLFWDDMRGLSSASRFPGGVGTPPGGTTAPCQELADTGKLARKRGPIPGESAARRRSENAAVERREAQRPFAKGRAVPARDGSRTRKGRHWWRRSALRPPRFPAKGKPPQTSGAFAPREH